MLRLSSVLAAAVVLTACAAETSRTVQPGEPPKSGTVTGEATRRPAPSDEAPPEEEPRDTDTAEQQSNATCEDTCRSKAGAKLTAIDKQYETCTAGCTSDSCRRSCDDKFVGACQDVAGCSAFVACMNGC